MERTTMSYWSQRLQSKDWVQTKMYHVNMLKKYIAREPEVDVVHTSNKDNATIPVTGVMYEDTDPELGKVPDLGVDLSEDQ